MVDLAISTVAQGLMWSILAIGVFLSFRVLDVPDMTCEGSFPLGGAIAASMIAAGVSPWAGLPQVHWAAHRRGCYRRSLHEA